jgi:hypothetical protein
MLKKHEYFFTVTQNKGVLTAGISLRSPKPGVPVLVIARKKVSDFASPVEISAWANEQSKRSEEIWREYNKDVLGIDVGEIQTTEKLRRIPGMQ